MNTEYYKMQQTKLVKIGWKDFIVASNPEYHVTLTFSRKLSDKEAIQSVGHFIKMLIGLLPRKLRRHINGVISAERNRKRNPLLGNYHFHIALSGLNKNFLCTFIWFSNAVIRCANKLKTICGKPLCNMKNVMTQEIYDAGGLAEYLLKDTRYPFDAFASNLWLFDHRGLAGSLSDTLSS